MDSKDQKEYSIEDLFRKKENIEKSINEQFKKHVTIMFTDIAGYTNFVETHGDLTAKALLQKHNEIIFPIIEKYSGNVIKTIGDAIMAAFSDTKNAVLAAVDIQNALKLHNQTAEKIKKINIRIGIHSGIALKDGNDYFGDAVNIAARIEPTGSAGQIMVSKSVYNAVKDDKNIFCTYQGLKKAKGKSEPLEVYRIFLNHDDQVSWENQKEEDQLKDLKDTITTTAKPVKKFGLTWNLMWKVNLPLVLIAILLFVYPGYLNRMNIGSNSILEKYMDGFRYLKNGDFVNAKNKFLDIAPDDSRSQEGLAALAYKTQEYDKANQLSEKSLNLNASRLYPRVIKGNILFDKGKYDDAKQLYEEAANLDAPIKWQKGEAFFRLGRISSFKDNPSQALKYYDQAILYDQQNTDIITAKGVLLEKMGNLTDAMELFQTAQKLAPNDVFVNTFYKSIQQKLREKQDKEKQDRVDKLIDELIANMKKKKTAQQPDQQFGQQPGQQSDNQPDKFNQDRWTSRPVTLFFAKMERKGIIPLREGEDEFFKLEIIQRLGKLPLIDVVDRELLDRLLQELKMGSSDLADPLTALELGRIISARLIGNIIFLGLQNETRVYLKLIETETSAIKITISETFNKGANLDDTFNTITARICEKIKLSFPTRGKITRVDENEVFINIGSDLGLEPGMTMQVFSNARDKKRVGEIKVVSVEPGKALGEIIKKYETINDHYLLEVSKP